LLVYVLLATGSSCNWGFLSWWGLALVIAAAAFVIYFQLCPDWQGPSTDGMLAGILIGSVAAQTLLSTGQHQEIVRYAASTRLTWPGIAIKALMAAALVGACAYLTRNLLRWRFGSLIALAIAARVLVLFSSPLPQIDVFVSQTCAGRGLMDGWNIYGMEGMPSPYVAGQTFWHFAYPPLVVGCNAASWLLFKDVRGVWILCDLAAAGLLYLLARRSRPDDRLFAELLALVWLFAPRSLFVIEQSWTEPLVTATMAGFALAVAAGRGPIAAGAAFGLWLSSKQYVVLAVPLVARLRRLPLRAWGAAVALSVLLALPFLAWNFEGLLNNLVVFFLRSDPRPDSNSLFGLVYALTEQHIPWGVVLFYWLGALAWFTWRTPRTLAGMLFSTAGLWMFFFLMGKQAFINYFYLIGFTLLLATAALPERPPVANGNDVIRPPREA